MSGDTQGDGNASGVRSSSQPAGPSHPGAACSGVPLRRGLTLAPPAAPECGLPTPLELPASYRPQFVVLESPAPGRRGGISRPAYRPHLGGAGSVLRECGPSQNRPSHNRREQGRGDPWSPPPSPSPWPRRCRAQLCASVSATRLARVLSSARSRSLGLPTASDMGL